MKYECNEAENFTQNKCNEAVLWPQPANASLVWMCVSKSQNMCV